MRCDPRYGLPTTAAPSAEGALRIMQADPHDILILDLQLPTMHGMEMFERVRREWPSAQVIVLTGFGDLAAAQQAIRLDVVEFLSKPCHLQDLERALDRARRKSPPRQMPKPIDVAPAVRLEDVEQQQIVCALRRHNGNRTAIAAEPGISRRTLRYRLADYRRRGIDLE